MSDPLKAIDLPTLYAMAEEAISQKQTRFKQNVSRQDAMQKRRARRPKQQNQSNATGRRYNNVQAIKNRIATNKALKPQLLHSCTESRPDERHRRILDD